MKNPRNCTSIFLVVIMLFTCFLNFGTRAEASDTVFKNEDKAKILYDLKLFKGVSETSYIPDLGSKLTRQQGITMLIRLLGKEADATALTDGQADSVLNAFDDGKTVEPAYRKAIAYVVMNKLVIGDGANINPQAPLMGKDYATIILRNLGFAADKDFLYDTACTFLSYRKGCTAEDAALYDVQVK